MSLRKKFTSLSLLVTGLVLAGGTVFLQTVAAASGSMYLSPSSKSVQKSDSFTLNVRINPGTAVDTVHVVLNYDTSKLKYVSMSYSGSPFTVQPSSPSVSGGSVTFDQAKLGGTVSSDSFIASVKFNALAGSGSSSITMSGSNAANGGSSTNPSASSASISFSTPSTSGGGGSTGGGTSGGTSGGSTSGTSGGDSSSSSSSGGSTTTKKTSAPKPTPVTVTNEKVQYTKTDLVFTSKVDTKVYVKYGIGDKLTTVTKTSKFAKKHNITLDKDSIVPGAKYSYRVISTNRAGVTTTSKKQTFTTKGLTITVGVFDKNFQPVKNKDVELHSTVQKGTTDEYGFVTFDNVTPGEHHVEYMDGDENYSSPVYVANNVTTTSGKQSAPVQNLSVVYGFEQSESLFPSTVWIIGVVILVIAAVALIFSRRGGGGGRLQPVYGSPSSDSAVTMSDSFKEGEDSKASNNPVDNVPYPSGPAPGATVSPQKDKDKE